MTFAGSMPGRALGHYVVGELLGSGGMGEVYRARDTRLDREVAVKVLPEPFAADPERLSRLGREAQLLAALNHPHIAAVYGLEEMDGVRFLVMELVEGETLAQRIARSALPLEEVLHIARQLAEALEAAHEKGIVHRDLKPANIKLTRDGAVKVLDFGLAKAFAVEAAPGGGSDSPTLTSPVTREGVIVGTAAYMSPEQARAKPTDQRADIWAYGCVLYELLCRRQAFAGETASDTLAAVLKEEPDWNALPAETPARLRYLLRRCLTKHPRQRLRDLGEARILLTELIEGRAEDSGVLAAPAAAPVSRKRVILYVAAVLVFAHAAGYLGWWLRPTPLLPLRKLDLVAERLTVQNNNPPAISPDARHVVYAAGDSLWVRDLQQLEPRALPGTNGGSSPFWSPDGQHVGFFRQNRLWRVALSGGDPVMLADLRSVVAGGAGGAWGEDDRIVFSTGGSGLLQLSARGGEPRLLLATQPDEQDLHQPSLLPGGRGILYVAHRVATLHDTLMVLTPSGPKQLLQVENEGFWSPAYSPSGHIVLYRGLTNRGIWAVPFSLERLEVTGEPFLVLSQAAAPSLASDGTLVAVRGSGDGRRRPVWIGRDGRPVAINTEPQNALNAPALSPDGRWAAFVAEAAAGVTVWLHDLERGTRNRLTLSPRIYFTPIWSPDGRHIVYRSGPNFFEIMPADGSGEARELGRGMNPSFTPDGRHVLFSRSEDDVTGRDIWIVPVDGSEPPRALWRLPGEQDQPRASPRGDLIAYTSDESGRTELYLKRYPSGEGKWQVSINGGGGPRWDRSGERLYFREGNALMEVDIVMRGEVPKLGTPRRLFTGAQAGAVLLNDFQYDVHPDGRRFLMLQEIDSGTQNQMVVIQNWFSEFRGR
jgi:eukaryotic-like serine/threonine-protein kinase